jgi:hypothetical protein
MSTRIELLKTTSSLDPELSFYYDYKYDGFVIENEEGYVILKGADFFKILEACSTDSFKNEFGVNIFKPRKFKQL